MVYWSLLNSFPVQAILLNCAHMRSVVLGYEFIARDIFTFFMKLRIMVMKPGENIPLIIKNGKNMGSFEIVPIHNRPITR